MDEITIRPANFADLARITEIHNYYVVNTHVTFDVTPFTVDERRPWFREHSAGGRFRLLVANAPARGIVGYVTTGRFRPKAAYETTVEASIACSPESRGLGLGTRLYKALFEALVQEDIKRIVAAIAQPNAASNALHRKMGFVPIGTFTSVGRKFGKYWDVLWLEKPFGK